MFGLTTTRRLRAELAAARAEATRQRERAEAAKDRAATAEFNREQILRQLGEADAANRRLDGRNRELSERLAKHAEADPEYAAQLERRVARLQKTGRRVLAAWRREERRADHLQRCYDSAVGLTPSRIADSSPWQPGYQQPKPKPEVAS
ncbi:hypothetical protein ACFUN7_24485 [Streptomyces sp. NPDC057236]|uniref:hypothetical protein n=1 Tax=Streptomyces sp. NPDC057236 TaxID=3346059 RepID=UPI00364212A7